MTTITVLDNDRAALDRVANAIAQGCKFVVSHIRVDGRHGLRYRAMEPSETEESEAA